MNYQFKNNGKFAILTFNNVYADLPGAPFQLSDGTWAMRSLPVPDLGIWKEWIGSIRLDGLRGANLVLLAEEGSDNPEVVDAVNDRLEIDVRSPLTQLSQ